MIEKQQTRILIVEDEAAIAMLIQQLLLSTGYDVCGMVMTGHEAVETAGRLNPDLIMMDIKIKGEMDGIETASTITSTRDVPIVFLTAYSDLKTMQRADAVGHYGFVRKPFNSKNLLSVIKTALDDFTQKER